MARPRLTDDSFLAHVFSPKKNARPVGLRKTSLAVTKGRRKARVNAFNRMDAVKQAILGRSGAREQYLRGEITFTDAKRSLRNSAVEKRIVKPLRRKYGPSGPTNFRTQTELKRRIADMVWNYTKELEPTPYQSRRGLRRATRETIEYNIEHFLPDDAEPEILEWNFGDVQSAARGYEVNGRRYVVFEGTSNERNPFWYH